MDRFVWILVAKSEVSQARMRTCCAKSNVETDTEDTIDIPGLGFLYNVMRWHVCRFWHREEQEVD